MNVKLLFDENWGRPMVGAIGELLKFREYETVVEHIINKFGSGSKDQDWIPQLAADGGWIVITSDRGRSGANRLPRICAEHCVPHIMVSGNIHNTVKQFGKARIIFSFWERIEEASQ